MNLNKKILIAFISVNLLLPMRSFAFFDGGAGWANAAYLAQILSQSIKRYIQLKTMIGNIKEQKSLLKAIHKGIENSVGLLETLPIKDQGILEDIRNYRNAIKTIEDVYGAIPKSPEEMIHRLHDQTVAESLEMIKDLKKYAKTEEENAKIYMIQSRNASPKGASRMTVQSNASILKGISQLIKLGNQNLKLQSELLALANRDGKKSVHSHQVVYKNLGSGFKSLSPVSRMPRL